MIPIQIPLPWLIATTIATIFMVHFLHKYFVKPFFILQGYKKYKGALCIYRPIVGIMREIEYNEKEHGDAFYDTKRRIREDPSMRFIASTVLDKAQLVLFDSNLIKQFMSRETIVASKFMGLAGNISELMKNGLVFAEGENWKRQRKLLSQVFHFDYMNNSLPTIRKTANEWIEKNCISSSSSPATVNVSKELKMYTSTVIWRIFFGEDRFSDSEDASAIVELILRSIRMSREQSISRWNFILGHRFFRLGLRSRDRQFIRERKMVRKIFYEKLKKLRELYAEKNAQENNHHESGEFKNLTELLLGQAEGLPDLEILSQLFTFFLAGTDTTSELLALSHYLLAKNPQTQAKLREEVITYAGKTETIKYENLSKMEYLNAVIKEALRIGGPASSTGPRIAKENFMLEDIEVKKDTIIQPSFLGVAFNPRYFANPEEFRPERWIEKKDPGTIDSSMHLPFSAGPRKCIGEQLALIEAKIMLCELVRRFNIDIKTPYELKMGIGIVYHAANPVEAIYTPIS